MLPIERGYCVGNDALPTRSAPNRTQAAFLAERLFCLTHYICLLKDWCRLQDSNL